MLYLQIIIKKEQNMKYIGAHVSASGGVEFAPINAHEIGYPVNVDSSSSMFQIEECELTVKNGEMTADMKMGGTGYLKLYIGTGAEAVNASE